jgi:hypothetical protein
VVSLLDPGPRINIMQHLRLNVAISSCHLSQQVHLDRNIFAVFLLFQSNGTWPMPLNPMIRQATYFTGSWLVHFKIRTQLAL